MPSRTDEIKEELGDIAGSVRLCQRRLSEITEGLDAANDGSRLAHELRRTAETFSCELDGATNVLQAAANMTEEKLGGLSRLPLPDHLDADLELLRESTRHAVDKTRDLAAAALWMMQALKPADRQMLVGLCERLGTFEAAIKIIPELLGIVGTSTEAAWALEDLHLLTEREWQNIEDVGHSINVKAVLFLIHTTIQSGLSPHLKAQMQKLHQRLTAAENSGPAVQEGSEA